MTPLPWLHNYQVPSHKVTKAGWVLRVTPLPRISITQYSILRHRGPRGRGPGRKAQIEPRLSRVGRTVGRSDIIHLNNFLGPVDDTVTAQLQSQSHKVTSSQATRSSSGRASRPSYSKVQLSPAHFDIFGLYLCHTSSVRSTSDSRGPVTRKSSG